MKRSISILWLTIAAAAFWIAGKANTDLLHRRMERFTPAATLENAPPLVAFTTVALGGFRGLLVDLLWLRISYQQDAGDYFELVQLADWITKLEPHCSEIWAFHAWNMAYNISVMLPDYADRWRWVQHGIGLLRDEGLVYNAGDPEIHVELGWLFQYKIGGSADDAHLWYKTQWSETMQNLLDAPYPDYEVLNADRRRTEALRRAVKLDPVIMQEIDTRYGPLNWLCPETHAIYWAYRARQQAPKHVFLPADRMIYQSLAALFRSGGRTWWLEDPLRPVAPDPALLPGVLRAYRDALETYTDETVRHAYLEFLHNATLLLAEYEHPDAALDLYRRLRAAAPEAGLPAELHRFLDLEATHPPTEGMPPP